MISALLGEALIGKLAHEHLRLILLLAGVLLILLAVSLPKEHAASAVKALL